MAIAYPRTLTDEIFDFLLSAPTPEQVIAFHPSTELQLRMRYLLDGNRNDTLKDAEKEELDAYLELERFFRHLKARAEEKLHQEQK
jgi:hypothetical protein